MEANIITPEVVSGFRDLLDALDRSVHTIARYLYDVTSYADFLDGRQATSEGTREFRDNLVDRGYAPGSVNTKLASLFSFFHSQGWEGCETNRVRIQKRAYISEDAELTPEEYQKLLTSARCKRDLLVIESLGSTGVRASELSYFTVEDVKKRDFTVECKRKFRRILIPEGLGRKLEAFAENENITSGVIFRGRDGKPLDRRTIWRFIKEAGKRAEIPASKVYPHSLRKFFARMFLETGGTLEQLSDVLGHSSLETTRLYARTSGTKHRQLVEDLGHILCYVDEDEPDDEVELEDEVEDEAEPDDKDEPEGEAQPETAAENGPKEKPHPKRKSQDAKKPFPRRKKKRRKGKKIR